MSVEVTFQHLECVNPKNTNVIAIIGRQADGKSVCVKIGNVMPQVQNLFYLSGNTRPGICCVI